VVATARRRPVRVRRAERLAEPGPMLPGQRGPL